VHRYFERNKTNRLSTQLAFDHQFREGSHVAVKNSVNVFNRRISIPEYTFEGKQLSSYTEATYSRQLDNMDWIAGLNVYTDNFREEQTDTIPRRNYDQNTIGAFIQNTWKTNAWLQLESGLRGDYVVDYGFMLLPRISALFKLSPKVSSRLGGGLGYKTPTIFTEETERIQYKSVLPVSPDNNKLERSFGGNFDVNYRTELFDDKVSFSINQLFFYTRINDPLLLRSAPGNLFRLENADGYIDTKGWETNVKIGYGDFKLFLGYTFTDAQLNENGIKRQNPLTARHRLNNVLMYEVEEKWKIGLEAYYYSKQELSDGTTGKSYWICGFMAEKIWERFSLFVNFENFLDTRQTRFDTIYTGTVANPVFRDIYAPLDGFVVNGGLKLRL
jgi:iron complex outermembrane receptor protein